MLGYLNLCLEQTYLKGSVVYIFIFKQIGSMALFLMTLLGLIVREHSRWLRKNAENKVNFILWFFPQI